MNRCDIFLGLIVCSLVPLTTGAQAVAPAKDVAEAIVPITELKFGGMGIGATFGTGFCLDPACRFIGTNYHVAIVARPRKIQGQRVTGRYLGTGPDDDGATINETLDGSVSPAKYTLSRDIAIFEVLRPLPHHHGLAFDLGEPQFGQEVDIYGYPKELMSPFRKPLKSSGTFKGRTTTGLLAFDYNLSEDKAIRPGSSGGIVVDRKTQRIVGILSAVDKTGNPIALAVPIQSLEEFVTKVRPFLAQTIFPSTKTVSPDAEDLYPKFILPVTDGVQHRSEEPPEVSTLRRKAQSLADDMRNFVAVQRLAWGSGNKAPAFEAAYEVQVIDGDQRFRSYPDGRKEFERIPFPLGDSIVPAAEWSELPEMVGKEYRLHVNQAADAVVNDRRIKVFQYIATVEDRLCSFLYQYDFGLFKIGRTAIVGCHGEVWTDDDMNIIRMSEHYELSKSEDFRVIVTYGWLKGVDAVPRLIPLTISARDQDHKRTHWCRGQFTDYQMFTSRARILAN